MTTNKAIPSYDFHESYNDEWKSFIAKFPNDNELDTDSITYAVKQHCHEVDHLIRYLYTEDPAYSTQMDIRFEWLYLESIAEEHQSNYAEVALFWLTNQLINMINSNDPKIVESIWYSIGVDYFECGNAGGRLFPRMYAELSEKDIKNLIAYSISIPWKLKVETYKQIILNTAHHEMLGEALYNSCKAYCFASAKVSEAIEILNQIKISEALSEKTMQLLTDPIKVKITEACSLPEVSHEGITGFISIEYDDDKPDRMPTWFPFAALFIDGMEIGTFEEDSFQLQWRGWDSVESRYRISTPEKQHGHEYLLAVKIPFNKKWKGQNASLKPI